MAILAVNNNNLNKNSNYPIAFHGNEENDKKAKRAKIATNAITAAGIAAIGILGYKKNWAQKAVKWLSNTTLMKNKVFPNYEIDNAKFMSMIGVTSIVLKDGLGCYLYVKQSLNNKKIPEDKRKFVAALDLANGGLMVGMKLLTFFTISNKKVQDKIFDKLFGKNFTRAADKALKATLRKTDELKNITGQEFHYAREADKKGLKNAFSYITSLAASTLLAKRVIVPFIATPLADKTKAWMSRNDKPQQTHKETINTYNTEKPAAEVVDGKTANTNKPQEKQTTNLLEKAVK